MGELRVGLYRERTGLDVGSSELVPEVCLSSPTARDLPAVARRCDAPGQGRAPAVGAFKFRLMGEKPTQAALTETRGAPASAPKLLYVGVDVGRHSHAAAAIPKARMDDDSWQRASVRRFSTTGQGFSELTAWLDSFGVERSAVVAGCEPTGGWFARTVVNWLERGGYEVLWLHNWALRERRQLLIGKQAKTDALDARLIARLLFEREHQGLRRAFLHTPPPPADTLRLLLRNRLKLVNLRVRYRAQLMAVSDVLFPELKEFFHPSTGVSARLLLEHWATPARLARARPSTVRKVVVSQGKHHRLAARLDLLLASAANSAGIDQGIAPMVQLQHWLLKQLRLVEQEIADAEAAIEAALAVWPASDRVVLASLPGMTPLRQAVLLSAIGDVANFRTDRQLRKLLGWYPEVSESGSSTSRHWLGRSGNRMARRELWLWSMQLVSHQFPPNPFQAYYRRLRERAMPGKVAIGHAAGKLASVLFFCLRHQEPYDAERHFRTLGLDHAWRRIEALPHNPDMAGRDPSSPA